ncbi:hypothetical protein ACNHUS_02575 [Actinomycetes bacterium M1A6_2h]
MPKEKLGSLIGAVFGLIFVLVNTDSLPSPIARVLRILAVAAVVAVLVAIRRVPAAPPTSGRAFSDRNYLVTVALEAVALFGGVAIINGPLATPDAAVAWISLVVGLHFLGLAAAWKLRFYHVLAAAMAPCGIIGLVIAFGGGPTAAVDVIGAVIPGALLLGFALWGSTNALRAR